MNTRKKKQRIRIYNTREARTIAEKNGWYLARTAGDHYIYKHPNDSKILTISHGLNRIVWQRVIKEYGLDLSK